MPITAYCDRRKLNTRQRLELFISVCEGVQHAHQKAIIHRDLKPSNILVTEGDGKPVPQHHRFWSSESNRSASECQDDLYPDWRADWDLGYISPEQADSGGEDIDTRSDVYSLGVVLYELLSGTSPSIFESWPTMRFCSVCASRMPLVRVPGFSRVTQILYQSLKIATCGFARLVDCCGRSGRHHPQGSRKGPFTPLLHPDWSWPPISADTSTTSLSWRMRPALFTAHTNTSAATGWV